MINGKGNLKDMYPNLDKDQLQPAGVDLTLDKVMYLETNNNLYGLCKDVKQLPTQTPLPMNDVMIGGTMRKGFTLAPHVPYIAVTTEKIKINSDSGQFYLPRSTLLRSGIDVRTAFGDPGFNGHLSFLMINHTDTDYFIEHGARFVQLVDIQVIVPGDEYDGDYQEW